MCPLQEPDLLATQPSRQPWVCVLSGSKRKKKKDGDEEEDEEEEKEEGDEEEERTESLCGVESLKY